MNARLFLEMIIEKILKGKYFLPCGCRRFVSMIFLPLGYFFNFFNFFNF